MYFLTFLLAFGFALIQPADEISQARAWIISQQNDNGGWSDGLSDRSGPGITVDALIALGGDDSGLENSLTDYLRDFVNQNATLLRPVLAAKLSLAAILLDEDPRDFAGVDLIAAMLESDSEQYGSSIYEHCLVMIAAYHADVDLLPGALDYLNAQQTESGGWGFAVDAPPDSNTTATLLCRPTSPSGQSDVSAALDYLRNLQNDDGGWPVRSPSDFGTDSDPFATAQVIMALHAAAQESGGLEPSRRLAARLSDRRRRVFFSQ